MDTVYDKLHVVLVDALSSNGGVELGVPLTFFFFCAKVQFFSPGCW